jgi:limonene-1,2-epoxide hydrolase
VTDPLRLAGALLDALAGYDADAVARLVDPAVVHWNNLTQREQGLDGLLGTLRAEREVVAAAEMALRHRVATAEGFVLELAVEGTTRRGAAFRIPVCLVVRVEGDRIVRIDEYADSAAARPIVRELSGAGPAPEGLC